MGKDHFKDDHKENLYEEKYSEKLKRGELSPCKNVRAHIVLQTAISKPLIHRCNNATMQKENAGEIISS